MADTDPKREIVAQASETWEAPPAPAQLDLADLWERRAASKVIGTIGPIRPAPDDAADGETGETGETGALSPRRGRPPGARSRSTEVWRRWIAGRFGSPLEALARLYAADPVHLAAYLGCKPIEATAQVIAAARVALPYLHQALPADIRVEGKGAFAFAAFGGAAPAGGDAVSDSGDPAEALRRWYETQSEENQRLIDGEIERSMGSGETETGIALPDQ